MIYAVTKCANEIEEFRYRFLDDQVVLFDKIDTSFTYMSGEDELFKVVFAEFFVDGVHVGKLVQKLQAYLLEM